MLINKSINEDVLYFHLRNGQTTLNHRMKVANFVTILNVIKAVKRRDQNIGSSYLYYSCMESSLFFFFIADSGGNEVTPLIEGPSDTSELYKRNLFRSTHLQENIVESTGPVLSFTLQLPQAVLRSGESTQEGQ